jgi:anti-anti-sigma regulatory factor
MDKYPIARLDTITIVLAAGEINGALFATLGQMVERAQADGCDFSTCNTNEEVLQTIEDFEDARAKAAQEAAEKAAAEKAAQEEANLAALASIAASMEYQNMLTLEDVEQ